MTLGVLQFGKYGGAFSGCLLTGKDKRVRNYLGLALIPQAGVAIGLAAMGARTLGGSAGTALETIILSSSVLYELIGPCVREALALSFAFVFQQTRGHHARAGAGRDRLSEKRS